MEAPILFYRQTEQYGFMSNFYHSAVVIDGKRWPTTEHYFQAMKFHKNEELMERVRLCGSPAMAKQLGGSRELPLRPDWESVKDEVMRIALEAKFEQHPDLWQKLAATKGRELVEHTTNDRYWADGGGPGRGKNMLGRLLVQVRDARLAKVGTATAPATTATASATTAVTAPGLAPTRPMAAPFRSYATMVKLSKSRF